MRELVRRMATKSSTFNITNIEPTTCPSQVSSNDACETAIASVSLLFLVSSGGGAVTTNYEQKITNEYASAINTALDAGSLETSLKQVNGQSVVTILSYSYAVVVSGNPKLSPVVTWGVIAGAQVFVFGLLAACVVFHRLTCHTTQSSRFA